MDNPSRLKLNSKLNLTIILLIAFVDYVGIGLVYPIFAVLLFDPNNLIVPANSSPEYRGVMLGILIALTPISQFFCSPILGAFSDIKGRRPALLGGIGLGCLGYMVAVLGIYTSSLWLLFLYRILVGASDATAAVAQATLADISTEENKVKRFAYLSFCLGLGFTVGPFIGGIIADPTVVSWFNYSTPLVAAGLMSLMNFILVAWKFPETRQMVEKKNFDLIEGLHNIRKVFLLKNVRWLFFAGFALYFGWSVFNEFIPLLLRERFNFSLSHIGEFYAYTGAWFAIGALIATRFVHRFPPEKIAVISTVSVAICMLTFLIFSQSIYIWCVTPLMLCSLAFAYPTATTIISNGTSGESQGGILGAYQSVCAAAMGLSPLIVGSSVGAQPSLTAWGGALCMLLACLGFWNSKKMVALAESDL
jgi:DHA1 family tetracycline resistance protein-like MFS transporter